MREELEQRLQRSMEAHKKAVLTVELSRKACMLIQVQEQEEHIQKIEAMPIEEVWADYSSEYKNRVIGR